MAAKKRNQTIGLVLIICALAGVFVYSLYKIVSIESGYWSARKSYENVRSYISHGHDGSIPDDSSSFYREDPIIQEAERENEASPIDADFKALREDINSEIVAWLYCPGDNSKINYPVVQHSDDSFYLTHGIHKEDSASGALFLQSQIPSDFSAKNNIIHGHHMKDSSMLATLEYWTKQEYYDKHPVMYLNTAENGNYRLDIIAAFVTPAAGTAYNTLFSETDEFMDWLAWIGENNRIHTDVEVHFFDRFVTLSTCAYDYEDARSIVIAKMIPIM